MENTYEVVSLKERYDLFESADEICSKEWPEFMLHDPVAGANWMTFIEAYKEYQLLILEKGAIVAVINSIPLQYGGKNEDLPEEGWDWGVLKAVQDLKDGSKPNVLFGVQVVINSDYQGKGISSFATGQMKGLCERYDLEKLIIAVRPNMKCKYPLITMQSYLTWKNKDGFLFDNWLRVHQKNGGKIVKVCDRAMKIEGTLEEWKAWTGNEFPGSGDYIIEGALNPIVINKETNTGTYIEPNVWVVYE